VCATINQADCIAQIPPMAQIPLMELLAITHTYHITNDIPMNLNAFLTKASPILQHITFVLSIQSRQLTLAMKFCWYISLPL
jgi:hypothetical protein